MDEHEQTVATDATQTDDGAELTWEERFGGLLSTRQSRTILAVGVGMIAALFVLFLSLGSGSGGGRSGGGGAPSSRAPGSSPFTQPEATKHDNASVGSPTDPNPKKREPGCAVLGDAPPGRRYIQIKNNCKEVGIYIEGDAADHRGSIDITIIDFLTSLSQTTPPHPKPAHLARHHPRGRGFTAGQHLAVEDGRVQDPVRRVLPALAPRVGADGMRRDVQVPHGDLSDGGVRKPLGKF